jgi:hypothetical protein
MPFSIEHLVQIALLDHRLYAFGQRQQLVTA